MIVIGVVGGVASGKSLIADHLRRRGAHVLDGDRLGHDALLEPEVQRALRTEWGDRVFRVDGTVDRGDISRIVFAPPPEGPAALAFLEGLLHPRIGARLRQQIMRQREEKTVPVMVLDAAVMFKAGWDRLCDHILFVDAPRHLRLDRARRRGWSAEQFAAREAVQVPVAEKRRRADIIIDNSGSVSHALQQVDAAWRALIETTGS
jgi:dephospho-CoA kinase